MNVLDLKRLLPLSEAYEFREDGHYLVTVSVDHFNSITREKLGTMIPANAVVAAVLGDPHDALAVWKSEYNAPSFTKAEIVLTGEHWTTEQAAELHRLIDIGTRPT